MAAINRAGGISDRGPRIKNEIRRLLQNITASHSLTQKLTAVAPTMKIIARPKTAAITNKPPSTNATFFSVSPTFRAICRAAFRAKGWTRLLGYKGGGKPLLKSG